MDGRAVELRLGSDQRAGDAFESCDTGIEFVGADGELNHNNLHKKSS